MINVDIQDNHEEATLGAFLICELCQCVSREGSFGTQLTAGGLGVVLSLLKALHVAEIVSGKTHLNRIKFPNSRGCFWSRCETGMEFMISKVDCVCPKLMNC